MGNFYYLRAGKGVLRMTNPGAMKKEGREVEGRTGLVNRRLCRRKHCKKHHQQNQNTIQKKIFAICICNSYHRQRATYPNREELCKSIGKDQ